MCALAAFLTVFPRGGTSFLLMYIGFSGTIWALKRITELSLCKAGLLGGAGERNTDALATIWQTLLLAASLIRDGRGEFRLACAQQQCRSGDARKNLHHQTRSQHAG
jgi:hypothetical protein